MNAGLLRCEDLLSVSDSHPFLKVEHLEQCNNREITSILGSHTN
jgi:hypothetical protein